MRIVVPVPGSRIKTIGGYRSCGHVELGKLAIKSCGIWVCDNCAFALGVDGTKKPVKADRKRNSR